MNVLEKLDSEYFLHPEYYKKFVYAETLSGKVRTKIGLLSDKKQARMTRKIVGYVPQLLHDF